MLDDEYKLITKEALIEIKQYLHELNVNFNDFRDICAKKSELEAIRVENEQSHRSLFGWLIGLMSFIIAISGLVIAIMKI